MAAYISVPRDLSRVKSKILLRTYDVKCPICGKVNRNLYLEETEGWMECDQCRNATKVQLTNEYKLMPVCVVKRIKPMLATF